MRIKAALIVILLSVQTAFAQEGLNAEDATFLQSYNEPLHQADCVPMGVGLQSDGKIVSGGYVDGSSTLTFCVMRHLQSGVPDSTFGINGASVLNIGANISSAYALAVQPDDKIILAGYARPSGSQSRLTAVRYMPDGAIDSTFGINGAGFAPVIKPGSLERAKAVLLQPDGKIVMAGYSDYTAGVRVASIARLNSNGTPDNTFGNGGGTLLARSPGINNFTSLGLQADGKIVAGGYCANGPTFDLIVARYTTTGVIDSTFGTNGLAIISATAANNAYGLAVQPDDKIVVTGFNGNGAGYRTLLARFNANGTLDNNFGNQGIAYAQLGVSSQGNAVLLHPNGKITVAGHSLYYNANTTAYCLFQFQQNGRLDSTYGLNGKVLPSVVQGYNSQATAMALQPDGKVVAVGPGVIGLPGFYDWWYVGRFVAPSQATGIDEAEEQTTGTSIYPNPTAGKAFINLNRLAGNGVITVANLQGQVLESFTYNNTEQAEFTLNDFAPGLYFINVRNTQHTLNENYTLIKQ